MKKLLILFAWLIFSVQVFAQQTAKPDDDYLRPHYVQKVSLHKLLPKIKNSIVLVGGSITNGNEWTEQLNCRRCQNRGISVDISAGVLARLDEILAQRPAKIFLMIGINDISRNIPNEKIIANYREFARRVKTASPKTKIYLQSVLPVNNTFRKFAGKTDESNKILNEAMRDIAGTNEGIICINLHKEFFDAEGRLDKKYTNDGLHLLGEGYALWAKILQERGFLK